MRKLQNVFFVSILLTACSGGFAPNPNLPTPPSDTEPGPQDTEYCTIADKHLNEPYFVQNCPELGSKTKKGKTFTQFCQETQNNGIYLHPKCLSEAKDCSAARACMNESR